MGKSLRKARNKVVVERVEATEFHVSGNDPYKFLSKATIKVWTRREFADGMVENALIVAEAYKDFKTDGASTFWPITLVVPHWRKGDDKYNAGPVIHDILYILKGEVSSADGTIRLSREEVDDILRGIWRCWGMSRGLAGAVDKAVEWFAGGSNHWGNDSYHVKDRCSVSWTRLSVENV